MCVVKSKYNIFEGSFLSRFTYKAHPMISFTHITKFFLSYP